LADDTDFEPKDRSMTKLVISVLTLAVAVGCPAPAISQSTLVSATPADASHRLGVQVDELDDAIRSHLGAGLIIRAVLEDSRAAKIGLQENDIIRTVNGKITPDAESLREAMKSATGTFTFEITRGGKPVALEGAPSTQPSTEAK